MIARCLKCDNFIYYEIKKNVPPVTRCSCGGAIDLMCSHGCLKGEHPYYPGKTFTTLEGEAYFYAYKDKEGDYYVYHEVEEGIYKMKKIDNPETFIKPIKK